MQFIISLQDTVNQKSKNGNYEFHISAKSREKYKFDESIYTITGNVIFANFNAVRKFTLRFNEGKPEERQVTAGLVNAAALIDEIYHYLLSEYEESINKGVYSKAIIAISEKLGVDSLENVLTEFCELFPPMKIYKGGENPKDYLTGYTMGKANNEIAIQEIILLYFSNINYANRKLIELFDIELFQNKNKFIEVVNELESFFEKEPVFGPDNQDIFKMLKAPILHNPDNLWEQLDFILNKWGVILKDKYSNRILSSKDLMKEDTKYIEFGGNVSNPTVVPNYKGKVEGSEFLVLGKSLYNYAADFESDFEEPEAFTPDTNWMPKVVLLAKNIFVWLDQLSKKYKKHLYRLDHIPEEEIDQLVKWNFNGLWLIGIWERSSASKRIKHIMGNIDAVASAYSLYDYVIAEELGGEEAYNLFNEKCKKRGIRLASDMVPNHTGIYSKWTKEHPEYFIQSKYPPFPNYTFKGTDLSPDADIQIRIEDGYYTHSDAAVIFERIDNRNGEVRYIYHGNDGTNMPWNDTAQLDMLKAEVREAVIQKIFEVARKFSIIRFDAAMTLTKRHFSRLWYPQPGNGGDIPSRSDYALPKEKFEELFPKEFWREVVDRMNDEMPETLLLAEAFWLMEGYFVRSLGMHRVYNSAFMNMLMKEENNKYRDLITNTLEFEPEILKRYVNFMSNPDEETAIKQFGTDDKYFGVCVLMTTLPGLPMFAHGQIEGYTEKYGMEYKRAYYNESPKEWLINRHEREIFPLMKKRYLFSQVNDFWFYDFNDNYGNINENVFAYSNKFGNERGIVFFNNKFSEAFGFIKKSTPKLSSFTKLLETVELFKALDLTSDYNVFYIIKDQIEGKEFLMHSEQIKNNGFYIHLGAFKYKVFLGFKEVYDELGEYRNLYEKIGNSLVDSVEIKIKERKLEEFHNNFRALCNKSNFEFLINYIIESKSTEEFNYTDGFNLFIIKLNNLLNSALSGVNETIEIKKAREFALNSIENVREINSLLKKERNLVPFNNQKISANSFQLYPEDNYSENLYIFMIVTQVLTLLQLSEKYSLSDINNKLLIEMPIKQLLERLGRDEFQQKDLLSLINVLIQINPEVFEIEKSLSKSYEQEVQESFHKENGLEIHKIIDDEFVKIFLGVNYYEGIWYYSKEKMELLLVWIFTISLIRNLGKKVEESIDKKEIITQHFYVLEFLIEKSNKSGYKLEQFRSYFETDSFYASLSKKNNTDAEDKKESDITKN